jgi:hypothetical protein
VIQPNGVHCAENEGCVAGPCVNPSHNGDIFRTDEWHCSVPSMLGHSMSIGSLVRVTGPLAYDEHAGTIEIHPVYSVDVVEPTDRRNVTGVWAGSDAGTYYIREARDSGGVDRVWWLGVSSDRGRTFANVFEGRVGAGPTGQMTLVGSWEDIPLGAGNGGGTIGARASSPTQLARTVVSGGFSGLAWTKLYDAVDVAPPTAWLVNPSRVRWCTPLVLRGSDQASGVQYLEYRYVVSGQTATWTTLPGDSGVARRPAGLRRFVMAFRAVDNTGNVGRTITRKIAVVGPAERCGRAPTA